MMLVLKIKRHFTLYMTLWFLFFSQSISVFAQAPEDIIPPCFTGNELTKVREWEKTWVGKRVNYANVDQVKDLLPDFLVNMIKEPKKWGASELWFELVPYRYCTPSKSILEAIKKYSPLAKLSPEVFKITWGQVGPNEWLEGYDKGELAGYPFPNPKTGMEMAWNFDSVTMGDNRIQETEGDVVNCRTGWERHAVNTGKFMYWTGRTYVPPIPKIENNPKRIRLTQHVFNLEPPDGYGNQFLTVQYLNPQKEDDSFLWMAMYRRIRKMSTTQKSETIDGRDASYRDDLGYTGHINRNTYKFLEARNMLSARHQDKSKMVKQKGSGAWSGAQRERCKLYLVEMHDKDPGRVYSKEILYLDGETWLAVYKESWDLQGRLWRCMDAQNGYEMSVQREPVPCMIGHTFIDIQRLHGSPALSRKQQFGIELSLDIFNPQYMQRSGY